MLCPRGGQKRICGNLAEVYHHNTPGHKRLPVREVMRVVRERSGSDAHPGGGHVGGGRTSPVGTKPGISDLDRGSAQ